MDDEEPGTAICALIVLVVFGLMTLHMEGDEMKRILDKDFKYRPSYDTDVKATIERIKREQKKDEQERTQKVQHLPTRKTGG